jgi:hypothetical protein
MDLEPKAQDIFDRIKPFSPETAYDKGLISVDEGITSSSFSRTEMGAGQ